MILGSRQQEILERARHRMVTAFITMSAPPNLEYLLNDEARGMMVKDRQPQFAREIVAEGVSVWKYADYCPPKIETDPKLMNDVLAAVKERTSKVNNGQIADFDAQRAAFDSEDLVEKAVGLPSRIRLSFTQSAEADAVLIQTVPFSKLKSYLTALHEELSVIGGHLQQAEIAHGPSVTAFEYYEREKNALVSGNKFRYGDVMLAKAHNLLRDMGVPLVQPPKARLH